MEEKVNDIDISIIVPIHNEHVKFLKRLLDSVVKQGIKNIEVLVVNDGSEPQMAAQYVELTASYDNVRLVNSHHLGVSGARNVGIDCAAGRYLAFADADDVLPKNALKDLFELIERDESDIAIGSVQVRYENGRRRQIGPDKTGVIAKEDATRLFLCRYLTEGVWGKLFRAEAVGALRFDEGLSICEDALFLFQLIEKSASVSTVDSSCYIYERHEGSQSKSRFDERFYGTLDTAHAILSDIRNCPDSSIRVAGYRYFISKHLDCIRVLFRYGANSEVCNGGYNRIETSLRQVPECMKFARVGQRMEYLVSRQIPGFYKFMIRQFDRVMR